MSLSKNAKWSALFKVIRTGKKYAVVSYLQKYDAYLSQKYGDYMTIPKQSGQRQHNFHYLDLNKPYREFEV